MSERLQRFRKLMAAFEGTSNPQHAIERGYYVDLPNNPMAEITRRIEVRPASLHLLLGGIGSGKTTQLLLTQEHLNQLEGFNAIYVDLSRYTNISTLQPGYLIASSGLDLLLLLRGGYPQKYQAISDLLDENKQIIINAVTGENKFQLPKAVEQLEKELENDLLNRLHSGDTKNFNEDNKDKYEIYQQFMELYKAKNSIQKDNNPIQNQGLIYVRGTRERIIESFSLFSKIVKEEKGEVIFIFDGLDRISDSAIFVDCVLNDSMEIIKSGIGVVLVGSMSIGYAKGIEKFASHFHYFPYLDISQNIRVKKFFTDILNIRDPNKLISSDIKDFLIIQSGGVLRDLMSLAQSAIEEAYVDGSDNIKLEHAEQAVASLARSKFMGLTDANLETLQKVISQKTFIPRTPEELELLLTGHILEYRHPRKYFAVHPVLVPLIQGIQEENKNLSVAHG